MTQFQKSSVQEIEQSTFKFANLLFPMAKQIGDIKLYSVDDLHSALGVNRRTLRHWFNTQRLRGQKLGTEWHITEDNLRKFLDCEEGTVIETEKKPRRLYSLGKRKSDGSNNE